MTNINNSKRIAYFDKLRILAAIFVPMIHVSAQYWDQADVSSSNWFFMNAYDIIGMSGVPIFFMLSGALMLNPNRELSFNKAIKKSFKLLLLYFFWLLFYGLIPIAFGENTLRLKEILYRFFQGQGAYHLWFIPELIILYLLSPILRELFHSKRVCEYFLVIYVLTGLLMPTILVFEFPYKLFIESLYHRSSLPMLTGYLGYYILGSYISNMLEVKNVKKANILLAACLIMGNVSAILIDYCDAIKNNSPSVLLDTPLALPIFLSSVSIFTLFKLNSKNTSSRYHAFYSRLASLTFGVYLIHPLIIMIFMRFGMNTMIPHTVIMIPVYTLLVFICSAVCTLVLSKIPLIRKLVL